MTRAYNWHDTCVQVTTVNNRNWVKISTVSWISGFDHCMLAVIVTTDKSSSFLVASLNRLRTLRSAGEYATRCN